MANIDTYLADIMNATYGYQVRQAIHDSIQQINADVETDNEDVIDKFQNALTLQVDDDGNATLAVVQPQ